MLHVKPPSDRPTAPEVAGRLISINRRFEILSHKSLQNKPDIPILNFCLAIEAEDLLIVQPIGKLYNAPIRELLDCRYDFLQEQLRKRLGGIPIPSKQEIDTHFQYVIFQRPDSLKRNLSLADRDKNTTAYYISSFKDYALRRRELVTRHLAATESAPASSFKFLETVYLALQGAKSSIASGGEIGIEIVVSTKNAEFGSPEKPPRKVCEVVWGPEYTRPIERETYVSGQDEKLDGPAPGYGHQNDQQDDQNDELNNTMTCEQCEGTTEELVAGSNRMICPRCRIWTSPKANSSVVAGLEAKALSGDVGLQGSNFLYE
jgi:hypothetical protein